jgi:putative hydroxymethylpyrimidine transport system substrate-binding protein
MTLISNHFRRITVAGIALAAALASPGCSSESAPAPESTSVAEGLISADRCTANQEAGKITYLTSYDLGGSVGILNLIAAKEAGFFADMCLDVELMPESDNNVQIVSAGTSPLAGVGAASDAMTGIANGANIVGVATLGPVGQVSILTMADSGITDLKQLEGKTLGYKEALPTQLRQMLVNAGVDTEKVDMVSVGFDPTILPQGAVDALQAYKANEPYALRRAGHEVDLWDPAEYGVKGTFSVVIANKDFAAEHPTAVEDFLRAAFHGFDWINESEDNLVQAIAWSEAMSESGYDAVHETDRWKAGAQIIADNLGEGHGVGWQSAELWQPEADALVEYDLVEQPVDVAGAQTNQFIESIYDGATLSWPAP